MLPAGTPGMEDAIYRAAGFTDPERIEIAGRVIERSVDEVAASIYSLSSSTPHLLGDRFAEFDAELRDLLTTAGGGRTFTERLRPIALDIWH